MTDKSTDRRTDGRTQTSASGVGRYVSFTPMWERTISGFRAGRRGYAASLLCRHINVIKNSDFFVVYMWNMDHYFGLWRLLHNVDCELYLLLIQWLNTNVYRCTPPASPPLSLTHISSSPWDQRKPTYRLQSHNHQHHHVGGVLAYTNNAYYVHKLVILLILLLTS